jgi:hypothetical protein
MKELGAFPTPEATPKAPEKLAERPHVTVFPQGDALLENYRRYDRSRGGG